MARWVDDNEEVLRSAEPAMPPSMHNRKADNWRPLLSIADAAGGDWPEWARAAAIALSKTDDAESQKVQLLADIQAIFAEYFDDRMPSKKLVERLHELEDRPWSDFRRGKPLTARQFGGMLRSFKIVSSSMRFLDNHNAKGYRLSDFQDVFSRYLANSAVTPSQVTDTAGYSDSSAVTNTSGVTAENVENRRVSAGCDGVTAKKAGNGDSHANDAENWSIDL
jgi:putative DNA primase/helicase